MNYVWGFLMVIAVICGMVTGRTPQVSEAVLNGGTKGVELCITLLSMMILWGGLTAIMQQSGLSTVLGTLLSPIMKWLFPDLKNEPKARRTVQSLFSPDKIRTSNKRVMCVETGEVFDSIKEVSLKYGFNGSNICACCKGRVKSANGYHWRYA
jgi:hypothetical protein